MNPLYAFALGFCIGAVGMAIGAIHCGRTAMRQARAVGYADGFDAGRASARRELTTRTRN